MVEARVIGDRQRRDGKCGEDRDRLANQESFPPLAALCAQQIAGSQLGCSYSSGTVHT